MRSTGLNSHWALIRSREQSPRNLLPFRRQRARNSRPHRQAIPIRRIRLVPFFSVQISVNPGTLFSTRCLREIMRYFPLPAVIEPQGLKCAGQAGGRRRIIRR